MAKVTAIPCEEEREKNAEGTFPVKISRGRTKGSSKKKGKASARKEAGKIVKKTALPCEEEMKKNAEGTFSQKRPRGRPKGSSNKKKISSLKCGDRVLCEEVQNPCDVGAGRLECETRAEGEPDQLKDNETHINVLTNEQEIVPLEVVEVQRPCLPPPGHLPRPPIRRGDSVYVMKLGYYGCWLEGRIIDILKRVSQLARRQYFVYKVLLTSCEPNIVKAVSGRRIAYSSPAPVLLSVGLRVIALFKHDWSAEAYYAGVVAEPPKPINGYRYLIFFDFGGAQYIRHDRILVVFKSSNRVWEDMHPDSREFVKNYMLQYPERSLLKLREGQIVKTQWNGKWWIARVVEIVGSLVKMSFDIDGKTEWIYRGSTRLGATLAEFSAAS